MICSNHKCIFIHIPKAAGTSVQRSLGRAGCLAHESTFQASKHKTASEYLLQNNKEWNEYFKFTVVRNPWDMMVSWWRWRRPQSGGLMASGDTLKDFFYSCENLEIPQRAEYEDLLKNPNSEASIGWTRARGLPPGNRHYKGGQTLLDFISHEGQVVVDYICRLESLQQDFDIVCDKIGIPRQTVPHTNRTVHNHYSTYYDDETREIVRKKFAKDIEYFGYKFEEQK